VVLIIEDLGNLLHLEKSQDVEPSGPRGEESCANCSKMNGKSKKEDFLTFIKEIGQTEKINLSVSSVSVSFFPLN